MDGSDGTIEYHDLSHDEWERELQPFPVCLEDSQSLFKAGLVFESGTEAMMYLHGFVMELLSGEQHTSRYSTRLNIDSLIRQNFVPRSKIEEVMVTLNELKFRISVLVKEGERPIRPSKDYHTLYRVTLKNGEIWAVDSTGAQFGHVNSLYPWHDFEQRRLGQIWAEHTFGHERYKDYQSIALDAIKNVLARTIELKELSEALEDKILALAAEFGPKLHTIWSGSDAAFQQAKTKCMNQSDNSIRSIMAEIYTAAQIMRRNKEIEFMVSKNMVDPEARKTSEIMTRKLDRYLAETRGVES